jgi:alpha-galactosidase
VAICRSAITAYKRIRDVVHLGDLYRVERPHDAARGVQNYVSADRSRAVVFVFQMQDGEAEAFKPQGLDADRQYAVVEIHRAPGRTPLPDEGKLLTGAQIMQQGLRPSVSTSFQATIVELAVQAR